MEKGRHRVSFHYEFGGVSRESLVEIYTQLWRTEDVKTSDVGVFAVHMVGEYDDLQYITINRFAVPASQTTESEILIEPYNSWPSSVSSAETSNVTQPFGLSRLITLISCRSPKLVPALRHSVEGVYESSNGKLRCRLNF